MSKKICLDPGHGTQEMNRSPDSTYIEHEFALDMAKRIRPLLEKRGFDVKLTREDASTPALSTRASIANVWGADLFVSLHTNAVGGGGGWNDDVRGWTAWVYRLNGEARRAADALLETAKAAGIHTFSAEIYPGNFTVLANTTMPAVLIEYLFHTSQADVALLKDSDYRKRLALATANGICRYFGVAYEEPEVEVSAPSRWAQEAAQWAIGNGIAKGYGDPDGDGLVEYNWQTPMTFERMVTLLYQYDQRRRAEE